MFKLWIDRNGTVRTRTRGSLEQQYKFLVKVLKYLQERVNELERIISATNAEYIKSMNAKDAKYANAIRCEEQEIGILQNRKENKNGEVQGRG